MKTPSPKPEKLECNVEACLVAMGGLLANECLLTTGSLERFEIWLGTELDLLLANNRDWETTDSNRNFFSR